MPPGRITPEAVEQMITNFHDHYEQKSGNRFPANPVLGVTYRLNAVVPTDKVDYPAPPRRTEGAGPLPRRTITLRYLETEDLTADEYERTDLMLGDALAGPAVIREPLCTTYVHRGQIATVGAAGEIVITRAATDQE
jgi:N-methylhydantoinase A